VRRLADAERLRRFLVELAREADAETDVYLTGGTTAVLLGWRDSTVDADILIVPERDSLYRAIPRLKEELQLNVEIVSPADFIPELPGWPERSPVAAREGRVTYRHYDPYAQALAKIQRGHSKDEDDVAALLDRGLVEPGRLLELFAAIEPQLYRYPALDPASFRQAVERTVHDWRRSRDAENHR
jgi:non-ribosomal peptide synthetase component F